MNIHEIKELAKIMQETGMTSLHLTEGALNIQMERAAASAAAAVLTEISDLPEQEAAAPAAVPESAELERNRQLNEMKSPMVGVFYAAPSPDAQPYVQVGSKVKKGDVLCIIEAMKLMNEITAEQDGEIAEICAKSGDVVEYAQPLFKLI